jgi:hypothetical protein
MCVYATVLLTVLFRGEIQDRRLWEVNFFDRTSGQEFQADYYVVFQYLLHRHLFEAGMLAITGVMSIALTGFLGYHCYITSIGMSTNEHFKWGDVKRWHAEEKKKYQKYLKKQHKKKPNTAGNDNTEEDSSNNNGKNHTKPHISDGDVTCTGGTQSEADKQAEAKRKASKDSKQDEIVEDPGPMPENIYNRGFVENWKEVLFPESIQRREAARAKAKAP